MYTVKWTGACMANNTSALLQPDVCGVVHQIQYTMTPNLFLNIVHYQDIWRPCG